MVGVDVAVCYADLLDHRHLVSPRMRHITLGDWFVERYESKKLGAAYAVFALIFYAAYLSGFFAAIASTAVPLMNQETIFGVDLKYVLIPTIALDRDFLRRSRRAHRRVLDGFASGSLYYRAVDFTDPVWPAGARGEVWRSRKR